MAKQGLSTLYPDAHLLGLPWELRLHILQELLCSSDPLGLRTARRKEDFAHGISGPSNHGPCEDCIDTETPQTLGRMIHPQILSVNKQLYEEGAPLLYSNTIYCRTGRSIYGACVTDPLQCSILGNQYGPAQQGSQMSDHFRLPRAVCVSMTRATIHLYAPIISDHTDLPGIADGLRNVCLALNETNVSEITIEIKVIIECNWDPGLERLVGQSFKYLEKALRRALPLMWKRITVMTDRSIHRRQRIPIVVSSAKLEPQYIDSLYEKMEHAVIAVENSHFMSKLPEKQKVDELYYSYILRQWLLVSRCYAQSDYSGFL